MKTRLITVALVHAILLTTSCDSGGNAKQEPKGEDTSTGGGPDTDSVSECDGLYIYPSFGEWLEAIASSLCGGFVRCKDGLVGAHDMEDCTSGIINHYPYDCHWDRVDPCDAARCAADWIPSEAALQESDPECEDGQQVPASCGPVFRDLDCQDSTPADGGE